jgi:hypothetical protein
MNVNPIQLEETLVLQSSSVGNREVVDFKFHGPNQALFVNDYGVLYSCDALVGLKSMCVLSYSVISS